MIRIYTITDIGFEGRYSFFDETKTKLALLTHYEIVDHSWRYLLFRRLKKPLEATTSKRSVGQHTMNEFLPIEANEDLQYYKADISYSWLGSLRKFFFQVPELYISFQFEDGRVLSRRAIKPILNGGVFINKFVDDQLSSELFFTFNGQISRKQIKAVKFYSPTPWAFKDRFNYTLENIQLDPANPKSLIFSDYQKIALPQETNNIRSYFELKENLELLPEDIPNFYIFNGWAFIDGESTGDSEIFVVLKSESEVYVFDTGFQRRLDLNSFFKTSQLDEAGFTFLVPKEKIAPGVYQLGFMIKKGDKSALQYERFLKLNEEKSLVAPDREDILNLGMEETYHYIDKLTYQRDSIQIDGWAFITGMDATGSKVKIKFRSKDRFYLFDAAVNPRREVTAAFKIHNVNYDNSGFKLAIPKSAIRNGEYQIELIVQNQDAESTIKVEMFKLEAPYLEINRTANNIHFNFKIEEDKDSYFIKDGWALNQDFDPGKSKTYLVFESPNKNYVFETQPKANQVLVEKYGSPKYLNAGIDFKIAKSGIEDGSYQVGILLQSKGQKELLGLTGQKIKINNNLLSKLKEYSLFAGDKPIKEYILVEENQNSFVINNAWAFIEGVKSDQNKIFLLLTSEKEKYVF